MPITSDAGRWLAENGHSWKLSRRRKARDGQKRCGETPREIREGKRRLSTVREFIHQNRTYRGPECLFVPGSQDGAPAKVNHIDGPVSAARYMALLIYGTPKSEGMVVRHLCGNGHLSCVNPDHLAWGSQGDNIADANKHRVAAKNGGDKFLAV